MDKLTDMDWICLGLGAELRKFDPFKPICQIWDLALTVYFNVEGDIGVAIERRGKYTQQFMDEFQVAVIKPGISFGEIGVLYGANRTASCVALNEVFCLAIDNKIFQKILGDYVRDLNNMRIQFLSNLKIFQNWDRGSLGGLLTHIYLRSPKHSTYIYQNGESNKNIYIVVTGELEIVAEYNQKQELEQNKEIAYKNNQEKFEEKYQKKTSIDKTEISLFKLTPGNYFGDEQGFNVENMKFSVRVTSNNTKIFLIPKDVSTAIISTFNFFQKIIKNTATQERLQHIYLTSQRRAFMLSQRYEFMRKFKLQRLKYEENQKLLEKIKRAKKHKVQKGKISKFFHSFNQSFLSESIKPFADHPSFKCLKLPSTFSDKEKLKMIDYDFEHCISNNIMSTASMLRQKRRHKGRYGGLKGNGWASSLIKEAAVDSIGQSLKLLRKLDSTMKINQSRLTGRLEGENHAHDGTMVVIERGDDPSSIFKTGDVLSKAYAQRANESTKLLSSRHSRKSNKGLEVLGIPSELKKSQIRQINSQRSFNRKNKAKQKSLRYSSGIYGSLNFLKPKPLYSQHKKSMVERTYITSAPDEKYTAQMKKSLSMKNGLGSLDQVSMENSARNSRLMEKRNKMYRISRGGSQAKI